MKRHIYISTVLLIAGTLAGTLAAQAQEGISTQLEVTRQYTPRVGGATKLPVAPDMTDTVKLRPEISYRITSTASATSFATQPYEAATVSAVPFERMTPLYLRAGAGAPFSTVLDLYYTPSIGSDRAFGIFANHRGSFSKLTNDIGVKAPATEMTTGVGVWGKRQWKRYGLEAELTYDNRTFDMYGYADDFFEPNNSVFEWERVGWNRVGGRIAFGDDFTDMSRFNFRVTLDGGFTHRAGDLRYLDFRGITTIIPGLYSHGGFIGRFWGAEFIQSEPDAALPDIMMHRKKPWQADGGMSLRMGKMLSDRQGFDVELKARYGATSIEYESNTTRDSDINNLFGSVSFAPRYILNLEKFSLRVGGDLFYINNHRFEQDRVVIRPAAEVSFNVVDDRLIPYLSLSSRIMDGSMEALSHRNPYIYSDGATGLATDFMGGVMGDFGDRFSYKITLGGSLLKDYNLMAPRLSNVGPAMFFPAANDGTRYKAGVELGLHNIGGFSAKLYGNWYRNKFDSISFREFSVSWEQKAGVWLPDFDAGMSLGYSHGDKFSLSVGADVTGTRESGTAFPIIMVQEGEIRDHLADIFSVSPVVDLFLGAEVRVARDFWVWVEGRNLANQKLYPQPYYRGTGANVVAGVKMVF